MFVDEFRYQAKLLLPQYKSIGPFVSSPVLTSIYLLYFLLVPLLREGSFNLSDSAGDLLPVLPSSKLTGLSAEIFAPIALTLVFDTNHATPIAIIAIIAAIANTMLRLAFLFPFSICLCSSSRDLSSRESDFLFFCSIGFF